MLLDVLSSLYCIAGYFWSRKFLQNLNFEGFNFKECRFEVLVDFKLNKNPASGNSYCAKTPLMESSPSVYMCTAEKILILVHVLGSTVVSYLPQTIKVYLCTRQHQFPFWITFFLVIGTVMLHSVHLISSVALSSNTRNTRANGRQLDYVKLVAFTCGNLFLKNNWTWKFIFWKEEPHQNIQKYNPSEITVVPL